MRRAARHPSVYVSSARAPSPWVHPSRGASHTGRTVRFAHLASLSLSGKADNCNKLLESLEITPTPRLSVQNSTRPYAIQRDIRHLIPLLRAHALARHRTRPFMFMAVSDGMDPDEHRLLVQARDFVDWDDHYFFSERSPARSRGPSPRASAATEARLMPALCSCPTLSLYIAVVDFESAWTCGNETCPFGTFFLRWLRVRAASHAGLRKLNIGKCTIAVECVAEIRTSVPEVEWDKSLKGMKVTWSMKSERYNDHKEL